MRDSGKPPLARPLASANAVASPNAVASAIAVAGAAALAARGAYAGLRRWPPAGETTWTRTNHRGEPVTLLEGPAVAVGAVAAQVIGEIIGTARPLPVPAVGRRARYDGGAIGRAPGGTGGRPPGR